MDNDIRNRFRGMGSRPSQPFRPMRPMPVNRPAPAQRPAAAPARPAAQPKPRPQPSPARPLPAKKRRKGRAKRIMGVFFTFLLLGALGAGGFAYWKHRKPAGSVADNSNQNSETTNPSPEAPQKTGTIRLVATGDFSAYDSVNQSAKSGSNYDYSPLINGVKTVFEEADINICSQATPAGGERFGVSGYPTFNAPQAWAEGLEAAGCNVVSLASRHTNDKGQEAIDAQLKFWKERENMLAVAGANSSAEDQNTIRYFTVKEMKFAYLAYTTTSQKPLSKPFGVNVYSEELAKKQAEEARKNADFVIVSMSWGKEGSAGVTSEQNKIAQDLANLNVDLILGNGSHITQPAKILDGKDNHQTLVWFSLGNAVNSQLPSPNLFGCFAIITIDVATGNVKDPGCLPVYMHYEWTAAQKAANRIDARRNLKLLVLDKASAELAKSQNKTTVKAQTDRLKGIITKFAPIKMLTSKDL